MENYQHILVALDISDDAEVILQRANQLAEFYKAKISLIHVVEPMLIEHSYDLISALPTELDSTLVERATQFLQKMCESLDNAAIKQFVECGSIKCEIFRVVAENAVDLIVMGTHGRHGVGLLLGSTATTIMHGTPCDVFTVRLTGGSSE